MINPRPLQQYAPNSPHSWCTLPFGAYFCKGQSIPCFSLLQSQLLPALWGYFHPLVLHPSYLLFIAGRRMLSITQSDVTPRVRLETSMAHMAEKHIDMLGQVRNCCGTGTYEFG